ncbi:hypothetical protein STENM327S_05275 [Streptomyces tendae]
MSFDSGARTAFAERLALLYREAGNPPLKRVSEAVVRLQRVDERGRPVRVSAQRISDWRRAKNVPAQFPALAAVLHVLIPQARRARPVPVSAGLYDLAQWQLLWERAVADPTGERPAPTSAAEQPSAEGPAAPGGVCPYRGLAAYRRQDADWFFGRERSTRALVAQLHATRDTGGLIMLVGASGAGKSSLLNAGLVPALRAGTPDSGDDPPRRVLQFVPGADPLGELTRLVPQLAPVVGAIREAAAQETATPVPGSPEPRPTGDPRAESAARAAFATWAASVERPEGAAGADRTGEAKGPDGADRSQVGRSGPAGEDGQADQEGQVGPPGPFGQYDRADPSGRSGRNGRNGQADPNDREDRDGLTYQANRPGPSGPDGPDDSGNPEGPGGSGDPGAPDGPAGQAGQAGQTSRLPQASRVTPTEQSTQQEQTGQAITSGRTSPDGREQPGRPGKARPAEPPGHSHLPRQAPARSSSWTSSRSSSPSAPKRRTGACSSGCSRPPARPAPTATRPRCW